MPYLIPYRTPLTPEQAERGFDHLLALQMGGSASVAGRAGVDPELAFILPRPAVPVAPPASTSARSNLPLRTGLSCVFQHCAVC